MSVMNKNVRNALMLVLGFLFVFFYMVFADVYTGWKSVGWAICSNFFIVLGGGLRYLIFEYEEKK